ncbi:hypothetical protein MKW94_023373 [Papaver nudicaule]|uniref:S-protein homolog n=1 Tax=Papaver nudicaule TaxID=74823 RepID=A0AA41SN00_PAPNU|nr:hypothetical protein [Papaver nudicaule]
MSTSFLVSRGSGGTIFFFTLLTLSLFSAQSVDGVRHTVTVENDIDPNVPLTIHCWSSEDDLGEHTLNYKQQFSWRFRINFFGSTTFVCDLSWQDPAKGYQSNSIHFTAYNAKRDMKKHCLIDCMWSVRRDGGYYGDGAEFPFEKMFSY